MIAAAANASAGIQPERPGEVSHNAGDWQEPHESEA